ncbi:TIGR00730 family Rossman fold protein [Nisaea acidiphila]|uniref:Cytokinin riboside 5'-monophosphate phosphoribohydrolase n=1 Tax=Nisaea acidiphila TaxID=1862145 RepID=A0A9J7AVY3_9PROT|nr:TIGR00730 family Rossman fold protein [Nisaea acidiphila]UUX50962.1 TIGR00730 family Rossman fold protein [Nisaea acidiphila]
MSEKKSICVFCGSSGKVDETYRTAATRFGTLIGERGYNLVYGGGRVGLMGLTADAALAAGADVVGVIPKFLEDYEVGHQGLNELIITDNMHDRKRLMYEKSDAFVILPGGLGTMDETFEVVTWTQLGLSRKPVVVVNVNGFWDPLVALFDHMVATGFARPENRTILQVAESVEDVFPLLTGVAVTHGKVESKWV